MDIQQSKLMAAVFLLALGAIAGGFSLSFVGRKYIESLARQPDMSAMLQSRFILLAGLIETLPISMMVCGLYLIFS